MERFLLKFDESGYKAALGGMQYTPVVVQKTVDAINAICGVKVNHAHLQDLLFSHGEMLAGAIKEAIAQDLDKAGIRSATVREAAIKGDMEKYYGIINAFQRPHVDAMRALFINEEGEVDIEISDEKLKATKERFSTYIETEKGLEAYHAHLKLIESINGFLKLCPWISPRTFPQMYEAESGASQVTIPVDIAYDRITQIPQ